MTTKSEKPTIGQKIRDLDAKVEWFYGDDFTLEQATENYKTAVNLAKEIQKDLETLKNEIEVIDRDFSED